jgi:LuxR family maltose regulon positive regulatory protein
MRRTDGELVRPRDPNAAPAGFGKTTLFVLDDYHVIKHQPIHDGLTFLLDQLPGNMHLILTTRLDPPLPVSRLRARNQVTEIRASDLRFDVDEATAFLTNVMGLSLSAEEVAALEARTEGWIATEKSTSSPGCCISAADFVSV